MVLNIELEYYSHLIKNIIKSRIKDKKKLDKILMKNINIIINMSKNGTKSENYSEDADDEEEDEFNMEQENDSEIKAKDINKDFEKKIFTENAKMMEVEEEDEELNGLIQLDRKKREANYNKAVIKAEKEMENEFEKPGKVKE